MTVKPVREWMEGLSIFALSTRTAYTAVQWSPGWLCVVMWFVAACLGHLEKEGFQMITTWWCWDLDLLWAMEAYCASKLTIWSLFFLGHKWKALEPHSSIHSSSSIHPFITPRYPKFHQVWKRYPAVAADWLWHVTWHVRSLRSAQPLFFILPALSYHSSPPPQRTPTCWDTADCPRSVC